MTTNKANQRRQWQSPDKHPDDHSCGVLSGLVQRSRRWARSLARGRTSMHTLSPSRVVLRVVLRLLRSVAVVHVTVIFSEQAGHGWLRSLRVSQTEELIGKVGWELRGEERVLTRSVVLEVGVGLCSAHMTLPLMWMSATTSESTIRVSAAKRVCQRVSRFCIESNRVLDVVIRLLGLEDGGGLKRFRLRERFEGRCLLCLSWPVERVRP
ncbi:hypothetical protein R3P38DRAFT_1665277 [Favolaschia claudopus]|uniref:Uncharacterized protein n=1 Tax=Favolaschia claudopus TaxID=2862362 RepID=A0AAW0AF67_9AGAR